MEGGGGGREEGRRAQSRVGQGASLPGECVFQAGAVCGRGYDVLSGMRIGACEQGALDEVPGSFGGGEAREAEGGHGGGGAKGTLGGFHLFVGKGSQFGMSSSSAFLIDPEGSVVTTLGRTAFGSRSVHRSSAHCKSDAVFRSHEEYLFQSGGSCSRRKTDCCD